MLRHLRHPATIIAILALVASSAGIGVAKTLLTGKDIKNGSLTGADIRHRSIPGADLQSGSITAAKLAAGVGTQGPKGDTGATGAAGAAGAIGPAGPAGASALAPIPSGQTVSGIVVMATADVDAGGAVRVAVNLPAPAPVALVESGAGRNVGFGAQQAGVQSGALGQNVDPLCTGNGLTAATAPAGHLCVYLATLPENVADASVRIQAGALQASADAGDTLGFQIRAVPTVLGTTSVLRIVWAYTAP